MAEFNHISVNADDEEEVFVVGVKAPANTPGEVVPVPEPELESASELAAPAADLPSASRNNTAGYEASRADLDAAPMSGLQKIIIVAAVLGIIAFVVYNFVA